LTITPEAEDKSNIRANGVSKNVSMFLLATILYKKATLCGDIQKRTCSLHTNMLRHSA